MPTRLLTVKQAAAQLGLSVPTVYRWIAEERIDVIRFSARSVRIEQVAIDALLEAHRKPAMSA